MLWNKWVIRGLIGLLLALLATGGVAFVRWTNPAAIRALVAEQLGQRFVAVQVSLDSARLRLLGGILARDLRIARSNGLSRADFLYVPTAVLYHDKEQLLDGKVAIRKIDLDAANPRCPRARRPAQRCRGVGAD